MKGGIFMKNRILVVEDTKLGRKLMKKILTKYVEDVEVVEAIDGVEALEVVKSQSIDLIILDLILPRKDGYEVLKELKEDDRYKDIPVIISSSITDVESFKRTLSLGAIDYFTKPISPEEMEVLIPLKVKNALRYFEQGKKLKEINEKNESELKIAETLQKKVMAYYGEKDFSNVNVYMKYKPSSQLGGDLFSVIEKNEKIWFMISDMTAQGVAAAMISFMLKSIFNLLVSKLNSPIEIVKEINKTFYDMTEEIDSICFSVFVGVIDNDKLTYSNGGHLYPILFRNDGKAEILELAGNLVGVFEDGNYKEKSKKIGKGDWLFMYTDGLYKHNSTYEDMNLNKIMEKIVYLGENAPSIPEFLETICNEFRNSEDAKKDDMSLLCIEMN